MSGARRRGGKPNRGGGKHSRGGGRGGGGGGGGGGGRKSGSSGSAWYEDAPVDGAGPAPPRPTGVPSRRGRGGRSRGSSRGASSRGASSRGASRGPSRGAFIASNISKSSHKEATSRNIGSFSKTKVPMQRLHMTAENQEMVRDMLRDLHSTDEPETESVGEAEYDYEYEECEWKATDQYWLDDQKLVVEDSLNFTTVDEITDQLAPENINHFAINKLIRYGFDRGRCTKAMVKTDGDIGLALEVLLNDCFELGMTFDLDREDADEEDLLRDDPPGTCQDKDEVEDSGVTPEEIEDMRMEELTVLSSIYGEAFSERIINRVWILNIDLPHLDSLAETADVNAAKARKEAENRQDTREVCRFFLRGSCKFGAARCNYKHESPIKVIHDGQSYNSANTVEEKAMYELEIRFPKGNKYPLDAPLVAFSSRNRQLPYHICLSITKRLLQEALDLATSQSPVVFLLVSILEDNDVMDTLFTEPPLTSSNPEPLIHRHVPPSPQIEVVKNVPHPTTRTSVVNPSSDSGYVLDEDNELEDEEEEGASDAKHEAMRQKYNRGRKDPHLIYAPREVARIDSRIIAKFRQKQTQTGYLGMQERRQFLPAWAKRDEIVAAIHGSQVVVISGMTGCGKSTQVPQYLLDASLCGKNPRVANILCTQPRRISAIAVSERVAEERAEKLGGVVGYQIRLETCMSSSTRLLFSTMGILLRRLEGDGLLKGVSHVILDEVHERSEESDFLLMVLRDLLCQRPDLKLILMSATLNAMLFADYFGGCLVVDIPGKTFPVDQYFLQDAIECTGYTLEDRSPYARPLKTMNSVLGSGRGHGGLSVDDVEDELQLLSTSQNLQPARDNIQDQNLNTKQLFIRYSEYKKSTIKVLATMDQEKINYELIEALLEWIVYGDHEYPPGAVLIFLPGMQEISTLYDQLLLSRTFGSRNKHKFKLIPLHSSLSSEDQHAVFSRPKDGVTKIVIATNIAETSITIDDVVYVIDAGRMKEKRYDSDKGMESLEMVWVSRANGLQRRGRAGRVAAGVCFHLFTSHCFKHHLREQPIPEIQRAPLESIVLRIKVLDIFIGLDVQEVLLKLIEPPSETSIRSAVKRLQDLGALDLDGQLTPLGYHLAALPVDVRIGKLILFGTIFRCLDAALTIAATLSSRSPFVSPFDKRDEADKKKLEFAVGNSDHLTMLRAYNGWISAQRKSGRAGYLYCQENFLSIKTLQNLASMKRQFAELLSDIGFIEEGLTARSIERAARHGGDGIIEITETYANSNSSNMKLLAAILVGALFPNVVQVMTPENKYTQSGGGAIPKAPRPEELRFKTKIDGYLYIHPSSVNFQVRHYESPYLVYHEKVKTTKVYIRDCTMVSVYPLLLFGGSISIELDRGNFVLSVDDGWIRFMVSSHTVAELVRELRLELDQLLRDKIETPQMDLCTCPRGSRIIETIVRLVTTQ